MEKQIPAIAPDFFNPDEDVWESYLKKFTYFLQAIEQDDASDKIKKAIFLNRCGPLVFNLVDTVMGSESVEGATFERLTKKLGDHFKPTKPARVYRHKFECSKQGENEPITKFTTRLRQLLARCEYKDPDARLVDRLIIGMHNDQLREKLITNEKITLQEVITQAQSLEISKQAAIEVKQTTKNSPVLKIEADDGETDEDYTGIPEDHCFRISSTPNATMKATSPCQGCRGKHFRSRCPFKDATCDRCLRRGHIAAACRAILPEDHTFQQRPRRPAIYPNAVFNRSNQPSHRPPQRRGFFSSKDQPRGNLGTPNSPNSPAQDGKIHITILINGHPCAMELDTGSKFTIVPWNKIKLYLPGLSKKDIEPTCKIVTDVQGHCIPTLGTLLVPVQFKGIRRNLTVLIVEGTNYSLLGREWMQPLGIGITGVKKVSTKNPIDFVKEFPEVFAEGLGTYKGDPISFSIDPKVTPIRLKHRRVPLPLIPKLDAQLDKLIAQGILVPVEYAPWETPIVTPLKPDGSLRVCADYKSTLNKALQHNAYPIPVVQHLLHSLGDGKIFAKLDLAQAYQQLPVDEKSALAQTIVTHRGAFKCTRLQFGISVAPGLFQSLMERLLTGIPGVVPYFDDILISGRNQEELNQRIRAVLSRIKEKGLRLKASKCSWGSNSVEFLGFKIDSSGIHPTEDKIRAIKQAPEPQNKTDLQAFLGLLNFYSVFLKQKATAAEPLHRLLQKGNDWTWGDTERQAFIQIKNLISSDSVIVQYNATMPLRLTCDASPFGVGAILAHVFPNGVEAPIAFFSRTLSSAERNYSQLDKEALAIVAGTKKFHDYLYGRNFEIITDHKPLLGILAQDKATPAFLSPRMTRWVIFLSGYNYSLRHRGGREIPHADALSRCPERQLLDDPAPAAEVLLIELEDDPIITAREVAKETQNDEVLKTVKEFILKGWGRYSYKEELKQFATKQKELSIMKGCILWGQRVVIPKVLRKRVLKTLHAGHPGMVKMKSLARGHVWWPGLDNDIETWVEICSPCQQSRPNPPKTTPSEWEEPNGPWSRIHIDFAGPFQGQMFLIVVDAYSKWLEVVLMSSTTTAATIKSLSKIFTTHGYPDVLVSDNGPQLTARQMEVFLAQLGIRHALISPFKPSANGLAERMVRSTKEALSRISGSDWQAKLDQYLLVQHITPNSVTQKSPAELLMGRKLKTTLDRLSPINDVISDKVYAKPEREFHVDCPVYAKSFDGLSRWEPGVVTNRRGNKSYNIALQDGRNWRRHIDHLRKRRPMHLDTNQTSNDYPSNCSYNLHQSQPTQPTTTDYNILDWDLPDLPCASSDEVQLPQETGASVTSSTPDLPEQVEPSEPAQSGEADNELTSTVCTKDLVESIETVETVAGSTPILPVQAETPVPAGTGETVTEPAVSDRTEDIVEVRKSSREKHPPLKLGDYVT